MYTLLPKGKHKLHTTILFNMEEQANDTNNAWFPAAWIDFKSRFMNFEEDILECYKSLIKTCPALSDVESVLSVGPGW